MRSINHTVLTRLLMGCLFLGLVGCSDPTVTATPFLLIPTLAVEATLPPPVTVSESGLPPTNTPAASVTPEPTSTVTETPVIQFAPTDTITPTGLPKLLPTSTSTPLAGLPLGVAYSGEVVPGDDQVHRLDVVEGQTLFTLLRVQPELDGAQLLYSSDLFERAVEQGVTLAEASAQEPIERTADFNGLGLPELMTVAAREDGPQTIVVRANAESGGVYRLYTFDLVTPSEHVVAATSVTLAPGASQSFQATSNGGKPVAVFARPSTTGNVRIAIKDSGGTVRSEADYGGVNSYETTYVLPIRTTGYTIEINNVGSQDATFEVLIVALQDSF